MRFPDGAARAQPTVAVQVLQALLGRASQLGLAPAALLADAGLSPAIFEDIDARVPAAFVRRLWEELPIAAGDPWFGLNLAASVPDSALGIVAYVVQHAPTLEQGFVAAVRYARLLQDVADCFVEPVPAAGAGDDARAGETAGLRFVQAPPARGPAPPRHAVEFGFARAILMARRSTGFEVVPARVRFAFERPDDVSRHEPLFGTQIAFGAARNELELDARTLALPQRDADPWLRELVEERARRLLDRLAPRSVFLQQVMTAIGMDIQRGASELGDVARRLAMAPRTLQRQLKDEGVTFRELVDGARRELAKQYLADGTQGLAQIALLLGFSEQAAFQRAFLRWTGMTPGQFRRHGGADARPA
jgi:AraC-like DNA-binding protein